MKSRKEKRWKEPLFATHAMGPDRFGGRNVYQVKLRQMISHKLRSGPLRTRLLLWYGTVLALYDPLFTTPGIACWVIGVAAPPSGQLHDAATLWAVWGNKERIPRRDWLPVFSQHRLHATFEFWLRLASIGLFVSTGRLLAQAHGWLPGLLQLAAVWLVIAAISGLMHFVQVGMFRSWQIREREKLVAQYVRAWVGRLSREAKKKLIQQGDRRLLALMVVLLVAIELSRESGLPFRIYVAVVTGLTLYSLSKAANEEAGFVQPPTYRAPRFPRLSYFFSFHMLPHTILELGWFAFTGLAIASTFDIQSGWFLLAIPVVVFASRFLLCNDTLRSIMGLIQRDFCIIHFRRFSPSKSSSDRWHIAPLFGAYGRNVIVWDKNLEQPRGPTDADSADILGRYRESIQCDNAEWRPRVRVGLRTADLVVFHWVEEPTPSMLWEFKEAQLHLPPERLIWVCPSSVAERMKRCVSALPVARENKQRIILTYSDEGMTFAVHHNIYRVMSHFRSMPRMHSIENVSPDAAI